MDGYTQTQMRGSPMMDDEQSASKMMEEPAAEAQKPAGGWVVDNVSLKQAKNGGWIVSCSKHQEPPPKNGPGYQSNDYTFASLAEAVPFIESEFGASAEGSAMPGPATPMMPSRG